MLAFKPVYWVKTKEEWELDEKARERFPDDEFLQEIWKHMLRPIDSPAQASAIVV